MTRSGYYFILALAIASMASVTHSARILALFPTPSRSHIISFQALTRELAARGHELVVVSSFPQEKAIANYTDIVIPTMSIMDKVDMFDISVFQMLRIFFTMSAETCENYLSDPGVQKLINAEDEHFDLILYGMTFTDCFLGFTHKYKVPVIGMMPMGGLNSVLEAVGNPNPYSYIPNPFLSYSQHMTFKQRLINTIINVFSSWARDLVTTPQQDIIMRKHFSKYEPIPYVRELEHNVSLLLLNGHVSISRNPRPKLPNVIDVGGMHITPPKELPKDLKNFLDGAKDGAIYFSMGSNLKTSKMDSEKLNAFVTEFSKLKQRVLWKSDVENIPGLSPNVKIGSWMPQNSILAHPNTKIFVTHGGLLSTQEAIYNSVPVLGIPIFGDQDLNMNRAEEAGYGLLLSYKNVTAESLNWALDTVLNQPSYQTAVNKLSKLFRDQPQTPLEQAVYWTEYILRHNGAKHMRSAALDLAWYQYFLLDVIATIAVVLLLIILATCWTLRVLARRICKQTSQNKQHKKKSFKKKVN